MISFQDRPSGDRSQSHQTKPNQTKDILESEPEEPFEEIKVKEKDEPTLVDFDEPQEGVSK